MRCLPRIGFLHNPAIPFDLDDALKTLAKLRDREIETRQAKQGLTTLYTIADATTTGYNFLFGKKLTPEDADVREELEAALEDHDDNKQLRRTLREHIFGDKEQS